MDDLADPYVMPQENGNRIDARSLLIRRPGTVRACGVASTHPSLDFTARRWTSEDLDRANHPHDLGPSKRVWLNLDVAQTGSGPGRADRVPSPSTSSSPVRSHAQLPGNRLSSMPGGCFIHCVVEPDDPRSEFRLSRSRRSSYPWTLAENVASLIRARRCASAWRRRVELRKSMTIETTTAGPPITAAASKLVLPEAPAELRASLEAGNAIAWYEQVEIPTYEPHDPSTFPMYLDQRVYQGSSGRVYPLPFTERIDSEPTMRRWNAVHIENRVHPRDDPSRARRADPRRATTRRRLRLLLPQQRHQACARRARRSVDERRRRVQLAAAPSTGDVPPRRIDDRDTTTTAASRCGAATTTRSHGCGARTACICARTARPSGSTCASTTARVCRRHSSGGRTSPCASTTTISPSSPRTCATSPTTRAVRSPLPASRRPVLRRRLSGASARDARRRPHRLLPEHPGAHVVHGRRHRSRVLRRIRPRGRGWFRALGGSSHRSGQEAVDVGQCAVRPGLGSSAHR